MTVKAVKQGDGTKSATATVTIISASAGTPIITPMTATVPAGGTQQFTVTNGVAVNWTVGGATGTDPSTWGTVDASGLYTAPVTPPWTGKVNITATSKSDSRSRRTQLPLLSFPTPR